MSKLLKKTVEYLIKGSDTRCVFSIPGDLWPVEVDDTQMGYAIKNLIINAKDAMPRDGVINIGAENMAEDTQKKILPLPIREKDLIKITIQDHGIGIPEQNLSSIFDPYFTTKQMGTQKGMGLGLSLAHSIIRKHGGVIEVESKEGVGTIVEIYLPARPTKRSLS